MRFVVIPVCTFLLILGLASCIPAATGPVIGVGVTFIGGRVVDAQALGFAKDMADCRRLAKQALSQQPMQDGMKLGCAQIEVQ